MSQLHGVTEYPNTFKRQGSFPLDNYSVFNSLRDATEYAKSNLVAYNGQIISVVENDKTRVYVLSKSTEPGINFQLSNIDASLDDAISDINNLINSRVGLWTISKKNNTNMAALDFDILYPLEADSYEVFFNDNSASDILPLSTEFVTDFDLFSDDSIEITLKFYSNDLASFELKAAASYKNKVVILGTLHLTQVFNN